MGPCSAALSQSTSRGRSSIRRRCSPRASRSHGRALIRVVCVRSGHYQLRQLMAPTVPPPGAPRAASVCAADRAGPEGAAPLPLEVGAAPSHHGQPRARRLFGRRSSNPLEWTCGGHSTPGAARTHPRRARSGRRHRRARLFGSANLERSGRLGSRLRRRPGASSTRDRARGAPIAPSREQSDPVPRAYPGWLDWAAFLHGSTSTRVCSRRGKCASELRLRPRTSIRGEATGRRRNPTGTRSDPLRSLRTVGNGPAYSGTRTTARHTSLCVTR